MGFTIINASRIPQHLRQFVHSEHVRRQVNALGFDALSAREIEYTHHTYDRDGNEDRSVLTQGWFICPLIGRLNDTLDPEWLIAPAKFVSGQLHGFKLVPQVVNVPLYQNHRRWGRQLLRSDDRPMWTI